MKKVTIELSDEMRNAFDAMVVKHSENFRYSIR